MPYFVCIKCEGKGFIQIVKIRPVEQADHDNIKQETYIEKERCTNCNGCGELF